MHDPDRLGWPPTRPDLLALVVLCVMAYALYERIWAIVGLALLVLLAAVMLPRMRGPFKLGGSRFRFEGELVDPPAGPMQSQQPRRSGAPTTPPPAGPPPRSEPPAG